MNLFLCARFFERKKTSTNDDGGLSWIFGDSNPGPTGYEPVALTN